MSRNFKLLEQLENEQASLAKARVKSVATPRCTDLKLGGPASAALNRFVERVFLNGPASPRLVIVTGAERKVGCTWVSANAAEILASETANKVCVVDANWTGLSPHSIFRLTNEYGLSDILNEQRTIDSVTHQVSTNLFVIPAGGSVVKRLYRERLHSAFEQLRQSFDVVLVDAAPPCPETVWMGSIADGSVLVIKAGTTSYETARLATVELKSAGKLLGTVLNQIEDFIPDSFLGRLYR